MTCSVHSHCGCCVYICLLEVHLHPGAHCTIPWLLMDSRCVYPYISVNTLGYSLWTPVLASRSSLSRPTKWLVHFLSPTTSSGYEPCALAISSYNIDSDPSLLNLSIWFPALASVKELNCAARVRCKELMIALYGRVHDISRVQCKELKRHTSDSKVLCTME